MYSYGIYFGLKVVPIIGTLGFMYILIRYMDPLGDCFDQMSSTVGELTVHHRSKYKGPK